MSSSLLTLSRLGVRQFDLKPCRKLVPHLNSLFSRSRRRRSHFDGVISDYHEREDRSGTFLYRDFEREAAEEVEEALLEVPFSWTKTWMFPHVIKYDSNDGVGPAEGEDAIQLRRHVDSSAYSGGVVCGWNVQGEGRELVLRWADFEKEVDLGHFAGKPSMRLVQDATREARLSLGELPVRIPLRSGSGYCLTGISRYFMTHEVVGRGGVRLAVIFRDEPFEHR